MKLYKKNNIASMMILVMILCVSFSVFVSIQRYRREIRDQRIRYSKYFEQLEDFKSISFKSLICDSEIIVLADVVSIKDYNYGKKIAYARLISCIRGATGPTVRYVCNSDRPHDVSDAIPGERILLFLEKDPGGDWRIAHRGRGRLPLHKSGDKTMATIYDDINMPVEINTYPGPGSETPIYRSAELGDLLEFVRHSICP